MLEQFSDRMKAFSKYIHSVNVNLCISNENKIQTHMAIYFITHPRE